MSDAETKIANVIEMAPRAERSDAPKEDDKPKGEKTFWKRDGGPPYSIVFPSDCPVEPLGFNGEDVYFLDQKRQLRAFKSKDLNQGNIRALFGELQDLKFTYWPRYGKPSDDGTPPKVVGWRPEQAADCLTAECARRGQLEVLDRVRGPGSWLDKDGTIVMHCGNILYHGDKALTPGKIDRHIYPSHPEIPFPKPSDSFPTGTEAAQELLALFNTWNWVRPDVDPKLLLGWIGAAILGGALRWRPLIWITGDKATGKSTLHEALKAIFDDGGLIHATDPTAAGLWQTVGHASLPIALDEIEAEQDNRKAMNIIKLARHAASGGQTMRGGSDHKSSTFTVRSCFLFSSILIPPMLGQDVSRMAILMLNDLEKTQKAPRLEPRRLAEIGAALRHRLLKRAHLLPDLIDTFKIELSQVGHGGRGSDQFGTLIACYELLMSDGEPDQDTKNEWASLMNKATLAESSDDIADHERCVSFLLSTMVDLYRSGERRTVSDWLLRAAGKRKGVNEFEQEEAQRALGNLGMKYAKDIKSGNEFVYIANTHQGMASLFRDSHWAGASGTSGVWVQAMRRVKGAEADQQRFNGVKDRCTKIPLVEFVGGFDGI